VRLKKPTRMRPSGMQFNVRNLRDAVFVQSTGLLAIRRTTSAVEFTGTFCNMQVIDFRTWSDATRLRRLTRLREEHSSN
jgi:hypothetical protein